MRIPRGSQLGISNILALSARRSIKHVVHFSFMEDYDRDQVAEASHAIMATILRQGADSYQNVLAQDETLGDYVLVTVCANGDQRMDDRDREDTIYNGTLNAYY